MAITNYTELQTSITSWLSRTNDTNLQALYPDFITFAEAKFNRALRTLKMEAFTTLTPTNGVVALPDDWLETRAIYINTTPKIELEYLTPENFFLRDDSFVNGTNPSRYYTIQNDSIYLSDTSSGNQITLLYYQVIPDLATNSTNWLLARHPDLYLAECLAEAYDVIKNEAMAQKWLSKAVLLGDQLISSDKRGKYSGSVMRVIAA
jgi:hypothetical protein